MGLMALKTLDPVYLSQFILFFSFPIAGPRRTKRKRLVQNTLSRFSLGACVHTFLAKMLSSHTVPGEYISCVTAPLKCHAFPQKPSLMRREFSCPFLERVQSKAPAECPGKILTSPFSRCLTMGKWPDFSMYQIPTLWNEGSISGTSATVSVPWHPTCKALSTVAGTQQYSVRLRYCYYYFLASQAPHL